MKKKINEKEIIINEEQQIRKTKYNSIEEYENYLNDSIKDSLSVFIHFVSDLDIFNKFIEIKDFSTHNEVKISKHLENVIQEVKLNEIILKCIENNIKEAAIAKGNEKKIQKQKVHYYFSKENGSNYAVSKFINPFQQKMILDDFHRQEFYNKNTELSLISEKIIKKLKKRIFDKFEIAFEEGIENERWTIEGAEIPKLDDNNNNNNKNKLKYSNSIIEKSIERLYPKQKEKEVINNQFYVDKINEFHANGNYLMKKIDFNKLFEEMKIQPKEDYKFDINKGIHLEQEIINDYNNIKVNKEKENSQVISKKDSIETFKRGDLIFDKKDLLITKSKMYIKVDRKALGFKLQGESIDASNNDLVYE